MYAIFESPFAHQKSNDLLKRCSYFSSTEFEKILLPKGDAHAKLRLHYQYPFKE